MFRLLRCLAPVPSDVVDHRGMRLCTKMVQLFCVFSSARLRDAGARSWCRLCHEGLVVELGSWFHLRNALRSGQSRVA